MLISRKASWRSALAVAAALSMTGCGHAGKYTVRLDEPELRRLKERIQSTSDKELELETDGGHTLSSASTQVLSARRDGAAPLTFPEPRSLQGALSAVEGGVDLVVVERTHGRANRRLIQGGGITAAVGGGIGGLGLLAVVGSVAVAGPANDTTRWVRGGGITMLVGAGVAIIGGIIALAGAAPGIEPGVPSAAEDLGRGRLR